MNKPQYLAELGRLLIFMTAADREETLTRIGALFDKAGPGGMDALLTKLGSPTSEAIRISRIYNAADGYEDELLDRLEREGGAVSKHAPAAPRQASDPAEGPVSEPAGEDMPSYEVPPLIIDDLPGFEPPVIPDNFKPDEPKSEPEPGPEEPAASEEPEATTEAPPAHAQPAAEDAMPDWMSGHSAKESAPEAAFEDAPELVAAEPAPESAAVPEEAVPAKPAPAYTVERSMPLAAGIPLFILSLAVIAVPLGAVCLALIPILVLPGVALLIGAWLAAVGGLWCISYIADAVMLFGLALVILAAGLVVLWLGLWLVVLIVSLYFRGMRGVAHLTLGKKVSVRA